MGWKSGVILAIYFSIQGLTAFSQEKDSIFLYKGQELIGRIESGQLGEITIDDIDFKEIDVKMYKIKRLNAVRRFKIITQTKQIYFGVMKNGIKDGWVKIELDDGKAIDMNIQDVNLIIALDKNFLKRLEGNLSVGGSYTKSSDLGQVNISAIINYETERFEYHVTLSGNASIDSSKFSRDREEAGIFVAYQLTPTWFAGAGFDYQRNLELSISRRYQELFGAGKKLFLRKYWQLRGVTGLAFNQEKSTSGVSENLLLEVPVVLRFDYFKYQHPNIQISAPQSLYFSLSQEGRIRYDGNISFSWQVIRNFYITFNPYANFDNQAPDSNNSFDYGIVLSVSYKF